MKIIPSHLCDIHNHFIPNVDDGSTSMASSIAMLKEEASEGVTKVICTPHFRSGMFETDYSTILNSFNQLKEEVKKNNIPIDLYLGREIYINSLSGSIERNIKRIKDGLIQSMNQTDTYLLEFSYTKEIEISEVVYIFKENGFHSIIAHIERYDYLDKDLLNLVSEIKQTGAFIQVNASSVVGLDGSVYKKRVWKLLKNNLVDIVSSDMHETRTNSLKDAYIKISKKLGEDVAKNLFITNPSRLIN